MAELNALIDKEAAPIHHSMRFGRKFHADSAMFEYMLDAFADEYGDAVVFAYVHGYRLEEEGIYDNAESDAA